MNSKVKIYCVKLFVIIALLAAPLAMSAACPCYDAWISAYNTATGDYNTTDCWDLYGGEGPIAVQLCNIETEAIYDNALNTAGTNYINCGSSNPGAANLFSFVNKAIDLCQGLCLQKTCTLINKGRL